MIDIDRACKADAILLPKIERSSDQVFSAVSELAWVLNHDAQSAENYAELIARGFTWVARIGSETVGFVAAQPFNDSLHVWQMSVQSDHQQKGIGRMLLQTVLDAARQVGFRTVTLTTFRDVAWNERFYRSCGFNAVEGSKLPVRLQRLLESEAKAGLPSALRCAMVCNLR